MTPFSGKFWACVAVLAVLGAATMEAGSALAASCFGGPSDSALNQYCEAIPTSSGGKGAGSATKSLGNSLPRSVVNRIESSNGSGSSGAGTVHADGSNSTSHGAAHHASRGGGPTIAARRELLTLPAANVAAHPQKTVRAASINPWKPFTTLLIVMAAVAVAFGVLSATIRRRRGESDSK